MFLTVTSDLSKTVQESFLWLYFIFHPLSDEQILIRIEWSIHIIPDFFKFLANVKTKNNISGSI